MLREHATHPEQLMIAVMISDQEPSRLVHLDCAIGKGRALIVIPDPITCLQLCRDPSILSFCKVNRPGEGGRAKLSGGRQDVKPRGK